MATIWCIGCWFTVGFLLENDEIGFWKGALFIILWPMFWGAAFYRLVAKIKKELA